MSPFLSTVGGLLMGGPTAVVVKATLVLAGAAIAALALRQASAAFAISCGCSVCPPCASLTLLAPAVPTVHSTFHRISRHCAHP